MSFSEAIQSIPEAYTNNTHDMFVVTVRTSKTHKFALISHVHVRVYQAFLIPDDIDHDLQSIMKESMPIGFSLAQVIFSDYFLQHEIYGIEKFFLSD
jgi:hypothetical protein